MQQKVGAGSVVPQTGATKVPLLVPHASVKVKLPLTLVGVTVSSWTDPVRVPPEASADSPQPDADAPW